MMRVIYCSVPCHRWRKALVHLYGTPNKHYQFMSTTTTIQVARSDFRTENDNMGDAPVPLKRYWGTQTERSRKHP